MYHWEHSLKWNYEGHWIFIYIKYIKGEYRLRVDSNCDRCILMLLVYTHNL